MKTKQLKSTLDRESSSVALGLPGGRVPLHEDPKRRFNRVCTWIRQHTSKLDYGTKWSGGIVHCNTNEEVMDFFHRKRKWLGGITREKFARHFANEATFYFAGRGEGESLVMLDIDCHESGTLAGAKALAASMKRFFPNLYTEVSTNGNGMHGFFLVEATGSKTNDELKRLAEALTKWLEHHPHDVQFIEVKGLAPIKTIQDRRLVGYKSGSLAKVPREAVARFEELVATTNLTLTDLGTVIGQPEADCPQPVIMMPPKMTVISKSAVKRTPCGSISGKHIAVEKLPLYERFAERLPECCEVKTSGNHIVSVTDIAIGLMILHFCCKNMNSDGSMPTARVWAMWDAMFQCGDITRGWNGKRYAAIRNYLSSLKVIEWTDETYRMGWGDDKGQAAKWRFNDQFIAELNKLVEEREEEEEKETSFIDTLSRSPSFIRPIQTWVESEYRVRDLKLLEMTRQVMLLYDQAA